MERVLGLRCIRVHKFGRSRRVRVIARALVCLGIIVLLGVVVVFVVGANGFVVAVGVLAIAIAIAIAIPSAIPSAIFVLRGSSGERCLIAIAPSGLAVVALSAGRSCNQSRGRRVVLLWQRRIARECVNITGQFQRFIGC